jgi:class 3 adenylate cyclase/tetratricopeptide (TPR) repeat protein
MPSLEEQIGQLEAAITAQEALRSTLGEAVVEVTLAALHSQLAALRSQHAAAGRPDAQLSPEQLLARLQSFLPKELAEKMRATGRIEGERKQVTVLFADLSGFTPLSERLDPEEVATLTTEALKELAEAVYQYEGYIDKFVGDAIMAVFGAPVSHEDDPERALRTALAMRERLEGFNRRWLARLGEPLALHLGVNTGPVVAGNVGGDLRLSYTVMGDTVNTAARLVDAAAPGQILVSRDTYRLTQAAFTFLALEPLTVKGKRQPLTVFELERARLHPGKSRGLAGFAAALVGREPEMGQLRRVSQELRAGRGWIVTVTGEAGIGKSRLMAEWRAELGEQVHWLEGRAFAHTTSLTYGPFLDLLRRLAGIRDEDSETQARGRLQAAVERFFPESTEAQAIFAHMLGMRLSAEEAALLSHFPAEALRRRVFALVEQLAERLASEKSTVLAIEDAHWADGTSLELLAHLLRPTTRLPLVIVAVYRLQSDHALRHLQASIAGSYSDRCTHLSLLPLPLTSSIRMVEQLLATPELPATLRALIANKAEGNPFFVEEVIRSLVERGALVRAEFGEGWVATSLMDRVTVPDTLQGLLMARLDRLPDETKRVAQQASVIGRVFIYRVLLAMSEHTLGLDADLSHLEREELIRERSRDPEVEYIFKHALTQEVAYQSMLAPRRKELHGRVGQAMESLFADRLSEFHSILAGHFLRGEVWEKAADYLIKAGDAAARLYAHNDARLHYSEAADALAHVPLSDDNRRRRADSLMKLVSVSFLADAPERSQGRLSEAETLVKGLPRSIGAQESDGLRLARIHHLMGRLHFYSNERREAARYFQLLRQEAQELGNAELAAIATSEMGRVRVVQGYFREAGTLLVHAAAALEQAANWTEWILAVDFLGITLAMRGHYTEGLAAGQRAVARALEANYSTGVAQSHLVLAVIYLAAGDTPSMLEASRAALGAAELSNDRLAAYVGHGFRAWAESRLGQHEAALESLARVDAFDQNRRGRGVYLGDWFSAIRAEVALNAGRPEEALALAQEAVSLAQSVEGLFAEGLAQRTWGQSLMALQPDRWDEAEAHMAASLTAFGEGECRVEVARTHLAWGQSCRDRQDSTAALEHFQKAGAHFDVSGLVRELELTRQLVASSTF